MIGVRQLAKQLAQVPCSFPLSGAFMSYYIVVDAARADFGLVARGQNVQIGREARAVLSGLARDAARLTGETPSLRGELASQALAVALQRGNGVEPETAALPDQLAVLERVGAHGVRAGEDRTRPLLVLDDQRHRPDRGLVALDALAVLAEQPTVQVDLVRMGAVAPRYRRATAQRPRT